MSTSLVTMQNRSKINPFPDYDSEDDESDMIVVKTVDGGNPLGKSILKPDHVPQYLVINKDEPSNNQQLPSPKLGGQGEGAAGRLS